METGGRPQIIIKKEILNHLTSIGLKNTEISNVFNVGRILVALCVNFHGLANVLRELEDDNETKQMLCEVH